MGTTIGFIVLLGFVLILREVGQALVLWKLKIPLRSFRLGAPSSGRTATLLRFARLPYDQRILCYGGGVLANVIFGMLCMSVALLHKNVPDPRGLLLLILVPIIILTRKWVTLIGIPIAGMLMVGYYISRLWHDPWQGIRGPLTIAAEAKTKLDHGTSYLELVAAIFIVLGFFSALPIFPLNGGRVIRTLISSFRRRRLLSLYKTVSWAIRLGIVFCGVTSDICTAWKWYSIT